MSYTKGFEISCDKCGKTIFIPVHKKKDIIWWLEDEEQWFTGNKGLFCSAYCSYS